MQQLWLSLPGVKNHWGPFPHPCPQCGTEVFTDAIMSEILCDDCVSVAAPKPEVWERHAGALGKLDTFFVHVASGWTIHHCGHPTANFPYYILTPSGERILNGNGRGFQRLNLAKQFIESQHPDRGI
jgi:hypothetical protein